MNLTKSNGKKEDKKSAYNESRIYTLFISVIPCDTFKDTAKLGQLYCTEFMAITNKKLTIYLVPN